MRNCTHRDVHYLVLGIRSVDNSPCMHAYITTPQNHGELIITNTNLTNAIYSR